MADTDDGQMGIWMTSALVVGTVIGAAIFMLPVTLAPLGANSLLGWLVSGAGALCIAYAFAQLSRLGGEGIQANIESEFGPMVAFVVAWAFWVSNWTAQATVAVAVGSTLSFIGGPQFGGGAFVVSVGIGSVVLLSVVNALGVRAAGGFSVVTVAIKVLPLLAVIWIFANQGMRGGNFEPLAPAPVTVGNLAIATALTFFALTGFEAATAPVRKVRDAQRTIPRAIVGGTIFVVLLYLAAGTGIQMLLPAEVVASSPAPFADVLISHFGKGVAVLAAIAITVSALGCLNGLILGTGELGYAMALRGDLPSVMTRTRGINTPVVSQLVGSGLSVLLLLLNSSRATANLYTFILLLSTAAIVVLYAVGSLAAWRASKALHQRTVILIALLFVVFAAYGTGLEANLWCIGLLATGLALRAGMRRFNSKSETNLPAVAIPGVTPGSSA